MSSVAQKDYKYGLSAIQNIEDRGFVLQIGDMTWCTWIN